MKSIRRVVTATLVSASLLAGGAAFAGEGHKHKHGGKKRGPSPAMISACNEKAEGDTCTFESQRFGEVNGVCKQKEDKPLFCKPDRKHKKRGGAESASLSL